MQEVPEHPVSRESAQAAGNAPQGEATEEFFPKTVAALKAIEGPEGEAMAREIVRKALGKTYEPPVIEVLDGPEADALREQLRAEDPRITENREICEHLIADWRLQAAIDLERARSVT